MSDIQPAAREHDHISHSASEIGGLIGSAVGAIAVGVLALTGLVDFGATTVAAVVVGAGIIATTKGWGEKIGAFFTMSGAGEIKKGASTVWVGVEVREAARLHDPVTCHRSGFIARASKTVIVENRNAARLHCDTKCGGKVSSACDNVFYGGPDVAAPETLEIEEAHSLAYTLYGYGLDAVNLLNPEKRVETAIWLSLDIAADATGTKKQEGAAHDAVKAVKSIRDAKKGEGSWFDAAKSIWKVGKDAKGLTDHPATPEVAGQEMPPGYKP